MTRPTKTIIGLTVLFISCGVLSAQTSGISGQVVDASGSPVAGATVLYSNVPPFTRDSSGHLVQTGPSINSGTTTAQDGTFAVSGLPAGLYYVCVYGPQSNDLSPCEWGTGALNAQIADEQIFSAAPIAISSGTLLIFRVNDPNSLLQDIAPPTVVGGRIPLSGGNFKIGIMAGTRYFRAIPSSQQGTQHLYTVAVPVGASVRPFIYSSLVVTSLTTGAAMATGAASPAIIVTGQPQQYVDLQVQ